MKTQFKNGRVALKLVLAKGRDCSDCYFGRANYGKDHWHCDFEKMEGFGDDLPDCVFDFDMGDNRIFVIDKTAKVEIHDDL
jgi:hypothetical protein